MKQRVYRRLWSLLPVLACAASLPLLAQTQAKPAPQPVAKTIATPMKPGWAPPKTSWGEPDISGIFTTIEESGTPMSRSKELADRGITNPFDAAVLDEMYRRKNDPAVKAKRTAALDIGINPGTGAGPVEWYEGQDSKPSRLWLVVDPPDFQVPPLTPAAQKRLNDVTESRKGAVEMRLFDVIRPGRWIEDIHLWGRCIARPLPQMGTPSGYSATVQITQGPGYVALYYEMIHDVRIIPTDGRPHLDPSIRQFLGDSVGKWEGNTLVVDVTNFKDVDGYLGTGTRESLHMVERFTRIGPDQVEYRATIDDATTYTRPWTFAITWTRDPTGQGVVEYACHEGNRGLVNMLRAARAEEAKMKSGGK